MISNCFKQNKTARKKKKYIYIYIYSFTFNKLASACNQNSSQCNLRSVLDRIETMPTSNHAPRRTNLTALGPVHTYPDIFEPATIFFPDTASVHTYPVNPAADESAITSRTVLATKKRRSWVKVSDLSWIPSSSQHTYFINL